VFNNKELDQIATGRGSPKNNTPSIPEVEIVNNYATEKSNIR
jgi:hypothetical protein